jgi:hypothetical protein
MSRYRLTTFLDSLLASRVVPELRSIIYSADAQLVAPQALPDALPTIERIDVIEYVRHSNLSNAHREYLLRESQRVTQ